ncbi:MAG: dihydroorotase [Coriobacteriales bacterium]|nr:dihydroorotase [Coriobacteriales bacterium]
MAFLLKGAHVVDPQVGLDGVCDVLIEGKKIAQVAPSIEAGDAQVVDGAGKYLVPGLFDMHVHFRDPGYEYKETIYTGARSATKGGFSDVATMPNTNPVTDSGTGVRYQIDRARHANLVYVHPIGALTKGEKGEELAEIGDMLVEGACAFSDDGHGVQSAGMMRTCMEYVSQFDRAVLAHCEVESLTTHGVVNEGRASTRLGMFGWPALGEELEIVRDIELARLTGCQFHVCHISTARGLDIIRRAKAEGLPVTCEVTPHHLFLTEENITESYNTNLKMNPPLRTAADAAALREGICDGSIDCVVTDHAPHAAHEKECEFEIAAFGTIGLETSLPLMLTNLVNKGKMSWDTLVRTMAINPRHILHLDPVKVEAGSSANLTLIDPNRKIKVTPDFIESKSKNSAFMGMTLTGCATDVFVEGKHTLVDGVVA